MKAVQCSEPGPPSVMSVRDGVPAPEPGPREVLVRVAYSACNRADTLQRAGRYAPPPGAPDVIGLEAVGTVVSAGDACERGFRPGDLVMALLGGGGYAELVAADEGSVMRVPDGVTARDAAAVPETWLTAFQLLSIAGVRAGDTVLVHAAGSGVAAAAIQMAAARGARVLATAGTAAKLEHARGLGAEAGWNYKETDFGQEVLAHTGGAGATVVLDPVGGGQHWERNAKCVAIDGRWVLYGLMGGATPPGLSLAPLLRRRVALTGTTLRARTNEYKADLVRRFEAEELPRLAAGQYRVVIDSEFPLERVAEAHERMEANLNTGKILLSVGKPAQ